MTKLTRRNLIHFLAGLAAWVPARLLLAAPTGTPQGKDSLRALGPYLDTLLPADLTPSATGLGVDAAAVALAQANRSFERLLTLGCAWLDQQANELGVAEFSLLSEQPRVAIITIAEQSPAGSLPREFFTQTLGFAFHHYYAQPQSWRGLGYAGPPQPVGFPDHALPPKAPAI